MKLKTKNYKLKTNDGQSLVEILAAMAIFVITSAAAIFLFFGGQSLSVDSFNSQLALERASEGLEAARSIKERNWDELTEGEHGLIFIGGQWQFSGDSDVKDIFTRKVNISTINANTKKASTTITWQTDPARAQKVELVEQLTNWKNPLVGGCGADLLSGNWASPQVIGSADIGPGNEGTDVAVKSPYVFVSATASSGSKPDLLVFNVGNPAAPALVRQIDIGSGGISALFLKDNYLYAASSNDSRELAIFNIVDPPNTSEAGFLNLSGSADALSVLAIPNSNVAAVGRKDGASYEIVFVDVSNPGLPGIISQTAVGGDVNDFTYANRKLYAVSEDSDDDIWVFDVINPLTPNLIGTHDLRDGAEDISVSFQLPGDLLVGNEGNKFIVVGATTTDQMYIRSSFSTNGDVNDIVCVTGNLAFLATANSTKEFIILNIANPDSITEYASLNLPQLGTGIDFADNKIFMSIRSNDALRIITSQ